MHNEPSLPLAAEDQLRWLRRLDPSAPWQFLDDRRRCRCCGKTFSGRQIRLMGGTRPHGLLHLACPTRRCAATPADWFVPTPVHRYDQPFSFRKVTTVPRPKHPDRYVGRKFSSLTRTELKKPFRVPWKFGLNALFRFGVNL